METTNQTKGLYISQGTDDIITDFLNDRFSVTEKDDYGKFKSKKKNKRITEAKVIAVINKFWVDIIHEKATVTYLNRDVLADKILSEKKYEVSMILRFMTEDGLIRKVEDHVHTKNYGKSKGYVLGEKMKTKYWSIRQFPADCAVIKNMIAYGERFAANVDGEAQEASVMQLQVQPQAPAEPYPPITKKEAFTYLRQVVERSQISKSWDETALCRRLHDKLDDSIVTMNKKDQLEEYLADFVKEHLLLVEKPSLRKVLSEEEWQARTMEKQRLKEERYELNSDLMSGLDSL